MVEAPKDTHRANELNTEAAGRGAMPWLRAECTAPGSEGDCTVVNKDNFNASVQWKDEEEVEVPYDLSNGEKRGELLVDNVAAYMPHHRLERRRR